MWGNLENLTPPPGTSPPPAAPDPDLEGPGGDLAAQLRRVAPRWHSSAGADLETDSGRAVGSEAARLRPPVGEAER